MRADKCAVREKETRRAEPMTSYIKSKKMKKKATNKVIREDGDGDGSQLTTLLLIKTKICKKTKALNYPHILWEVIDLQRIA